MCIRDRIYYRVNSLMNPVKLPAATAERVKGMVKIREVVRELIDLQMEENATDEAIQELQVKLNQVYDTYTEKYGVIGSNANKRAFSCLLYTSYLPDTLPDPLYILRYSY